ncbi:MAG: DHH family phosphoesterase [Firmicutes bacterium]|nr:DHH family phosphoesterase [Bacillota bacterium]
MTDKENIKNIDNIQKILAKNAPFPMCIINEQGKVTVASSKIGDVFIYDDIKDSDIFALTGIKYKDYEAAASGEKSLTISRNDRIFRISANEIEDVDGYMVIYFHDITNLEGLKELYNSEKVCIALVHVDNFDELLKNTEEENEMTLSSVIDKTLRQWGARMNAGVVKYREDMYFFVMNNSSCEKIIENKFAILDDIRAIETEGEFPVTISIGIGAGGKTIVQTDQYAKDALDLALGRGGDQAVIKNISNIQYYGGKTQVIERGNKGKSRVIGHALKLLIDQAEKVVIMGHTNPDMDAFGAALGITRLIRNTNKETYIVINNVTESLSEIYKQAKETELYTFINSEKARNIVDKDTLLIVLDTHRPSYTDCPELINMTDKIVVIDHHRKDEESVENPTLAYMESYASSTSELVSEILQYSDEKKNVTRFEAEALLAGITVDTNNFAVKTGVRTFEAASWLRRSGADTAAVKKFLRTDLESFMLRSKCVADAEIINDGQIALSVMEGDSPDCQILCAQAADQLLSIKGIVASFVAGVNSFGKTVVSARSLGDINVQVIMEKMGGGGHLTTAAAQVDTAPKEVLAELKEMLIEEEEI